MSACVIPSPRFKADDPQKIALALRRFLILLSRRLPPVNWHFRCHRWNIAWIGTNYLGTMMSMALWRRVIFIRSQLCRVISW